MSRARLLGRRDFLLGAAAAAAATPFAAIPTAAFARTQPARFSIRVASNQGAENASIQQLMLDRGFARALLLNTEIVESRSISAPMEALLSGEADVCMISGFVGVLPAIEQGKELRLIGAAMLLPALAVYSGRNDIHSVADLAGRTVGIGGTNGLLHILMLALLRKKGINAAAITFVNSGSNAQVMEAVTAGRVDAGLSGLAGTSATAANGATVPAAAPHLLSDGQLWQELPEYTYQPAYASTRALQQNPEGVAHCLAAYTRLFRYLSTPASRAAYLAARRRATDEGNPADAIAVWNFIQARQPYALQPGLTPQRVAYLQQLNVALGLQSEVLPYERVFDPAPAQRALRLLPGRSLPY